jgi:hypothetical protein
MAGAVTDSLGGLSHWWAVAKLARHQALDLAFEGSNPSRPAIFVLKLALWKIHLADREL